MGAGSRRKGAEAEREVARLFAAAGFAARRTPNSGGLHVPGDLTDPFGQPVRLASGENLHVEVKRQERWDIPAYLRQAYKDAPKTAVPVVFVRRSKHGHDPCGDWHAIIDAQWLLALLSEWNWMHEATYGPN